MVYVPSRFPINSHYIQLALTMQRIDAIGVQGYYVRSLDEQETNIRKADFIVLSDHAGVFYPGGQMTPQLLNYLRADNAFRQIALYVHPDGKATYLFERVGDASRMVRAGVKALGGTHADRRQRTFGGEFEHEVA